MSHHLVGVTEIADMAGVTTQAVWFWQKMPHMGFPEPDMVLAMGPMWKKDAVERWLKAREQNAVSTTKRRKR
jgi:hypothetical protein